MFKLIDLLKKHLSDWREERYLEKHGCANWKEYYYKYDGDINKRAGTAKQFYKDYPFVYCYDYNHQNVYYENYELQHEQIKDWCKDNCEGKWRSDRLRGIVVGEECILHDVGGYDNMFYAFKQESDYLWFLMRWS